MKFYLTLLLLSTTSAFAQPDQLLTELNPDQFNREFSDYDPNTALFCGQVSEMVYWNAKKIEATYQKIITQYPSTPIRYTFIDYKKSHTQALLWCTKDFMVIAFRGTEPSRLRDLITDFKFWNYENHPSQQEALANMPPGHGGFRRSLMNLITEEDLFRQIDELIRNINPAADLSKFPIYLTGHSLGAAISQLFIECLQYRKYNFAGAYHFAPPLAVACSMNPYMRETYGKKVYDIINYKDYIARAGRIDVAHFGKFVRICDDKKLYYETESYVKFTKREYMWVLKYHKLANHLSAIRDPANSTANIVTRSVGETPCMGEEIVVVDPCKK